MYAAVDGVGLNRTVAGAAYRVDAIGFAPIQGATRVTVESVGYRRRAARHQPRRDASARCGSRIELNIVRRRVGALHVDRGSRVEVGVENAARAETQIRRGL